ncbi:MAG: hypothetical protein DRG24_00990 [Epsilonproteobacteria bacterium]|nr:MAG: hypothetical protein DRG24_00990 [Campylobacterota bacterium]
MNLMSIATDLIQDQMGDSVNSSGISEGLGALFNNENGEMDIGGIVSNMALNGGLSSMVSSWLGDGENASIDAETISQIFDADKLGAFASSLGLNINSAMSLLSNVLPGLVDQASSGGNLLESVGGLDSAFGFAKKFF